MTDAVPTPPPAAAAGPSEEDMAGRALAMAGISLWSIDLAGARIRFDGEGTRMLGLAPPPDGLPLDQVRGLIHPDDRGRVERATEEASDTDRLVDAVVRYRVASGAYRHILTRRYRVRDAEGRVVGLRGMSMDVDELVQERQRSLSLLERMQMVAETVGVGFWWRDMEAGVFGWDDQMYRLHQRRPEEGPPGLDEWIARHVHPDDRAWLEARQDVHKDAWSPASDVVFRIPAPGGGVRWIQAWTRRLLRDGHHVSLGMHMDVTERLQAEQRAEAERRRVDELARERDRAQQASAAKSALMARVSHELRTPMNAVLGFADLMAHDSHAPLPAAQAERLARIRAAGTHLLGLIDELLELSRDEAGDGPLWPRSTVPPAALAEPPPPAPTPAPLRVLYIEDNPVNEMLVREMLNLRPGVAFDSAPDGASGIARARAAPTPDLVLLDLQLPDMDGTEVLARLHGEPALARCRFVALSANAMPEDVSAALAAGFSEYWTKPLNLQQFLADIDALAARLGRA